MVTLMQELFLMYQLLSKMILSFIHFDNELKFKYVFHLISIFSKVSNI